MKRLSTLAAASAVLAAALMTSGCITVIDADSDDAWRGNNAQPFDAARDECDDRTESRDAFIVCMAEKGWTRG